MGEQKAVALKYTEDLPAPFIAARGKGSLASNLVRIAEDAGLPIQRDNDLSEILFHLEVGSFIPEELYEIIARLYTFVLEIQDEI